MADAAPRPDPAAPYVFVSYASADRARVMPLVGALERAGVTVWLDQQGIAGGENYGTVIADAVKGSAAFVLMASAASLTSRNCKQEIALGWRFERPYLPLLLEEVTIPDDLAYWLEAAQWIEVLDKPEAVWLPQVLTALAPLGIAPAPPPPEAIRLAGRERELALLREKLAAAKQGKGGLVLIGGEAGIGKTTLAEATLRDAADAGCIVLEGHCFDLADTPPYGPWIDLFAHYVPSPSSPPLPPAFAERGTVGVVSSQMALFVAVEDFLKALAARQPIVVLLDDLHWADPASLELLRFLARSVAGLPLLVLVTYRSDELTRKHPLYTLIPQLARESGSARIDLHSLDDDAVRTLITERYHLPDDATARLASYLQTRAEGNALFVGELLRSLEEASALRQEDDEWRLGDLAGVAIPALLRQVIDGRLARLGDESQRLLAVAAVIGHEVPLAVWATVGEVGEDDVLAVAEEGLDAHLLIEEESGVHVRFAHALIRESLFENIPAIRRRRIHRRVGEALVSERVADPDTVAYHFQQSGDARAVEWLVKAGERAQLAYAWLTAAERYEGALALLEGGDGDLGERGWLRYRVARMRRNGAPSQCIEYLDEALGIAAAIGDAALAAAARYSRSMCLAYLNDPNTVREMTAGCDALEALPPEEQARLDLGTDDGGLPTITNARGFLVIIQLMNGRIAEAIAMGEAMVNGKPRNTPLAEIAWSDYGDRDAGLGIAYALTGRPDDARRAFERAQACFREVGRYTGNHSTIELVALSFPYDADRPDERERLAEEAAEYYRRLGGGPTYDRLAYLPVLALAGRWAEAREGAEAARVRLSKGLFRLVATVVLCDIERARGEAEAAWAHIREELPSGPQIIHHSSTWFALPLMRGAAPLSLNAHDLATAKEWLDAHDRWLAWSGAVLGQSEGQTLWAQYYRQAGDVTQAREQAARVLTHATAPRQPLALLAAHRLVGELDTDAGRHEDAARHLAESLAIADACQAPYERALTLLAMAELKTATGNIDAAKALIDEVRAICEPLGAKPTLARAGRGG